MTLILFLHFLFGLWFAYQTYKSRFTSIFSVFAIKTYVFSYLILLFILTQTPIILIIFGIYVPIFTFIVAEWLLIYKRSRQFREQFLHLLDTVIARMKMGRSFREALDLSIESIKTPFLKDDFQELRDRMVYSQTLRNHASREILFIFQTFQQADQDLQPISRLHYVRQALKIEMNFQRKVQHVLFQVHLQSAILIGIFVALFVFSLLYYGTQFLFLMLGASFIFLLGTLTIFLFGRKMKWTL